MNDPEVIESLKFLSKKVKKKNILNMLKLRNI